jgi:hypothetical protein
VNQIEPAAATTSVTGHHSSAQSQSMIAAAKSSRARSFISPPVTNSFTAG